jgi:hypothetical protein
MLHRFNFMTGIRDTLLLFLGFLFFSCAGLKAQPSELRPERPSMISVSIDPETGFVVITWAPSPTPELVDYYFVGEVQDFSNTIREVSSPIYPPQSIYYITTDDHLSGSMAYTVKAVNDLGAGDRYDSFYAIPDSTIFLEAEFDSCNGTISLTWNDYNSWRGSIDRYEVSRRLDAGIYVPEVVVEEGTNSLQLGNLEVNQSYDLFIEAFHEDGRSSKSNMVSLVTNMTTVPGYINADYATISDGNHIDLAFTVGGTSGLSNYRLLRSNTFDGPYIAVDSFDTNESHIVYTDDVNFLNAVYFYKLQVVNNCGLPSTTSNNANNIIVNGSLSDFNAMLEWNEYRDWEGKVNQYQIVRIVGRNNPVTDTIGSTGTTFYNDDINNLINYIDPAEGLVCYSVVATENTNMYGITGRSESNQVCFSINPGVRIPNAFIPNDSEPENQVFEPVFSFLPEHYEMTIYNRLGSKIWEGKGPWDGRVNGKFVHEGVYVYHIRVFDYAAEIKEYQGRVTVIYR